MIGAVQIQAPASFTPMFSFITGNGNINLVGLIP